MGLIFIKQNLTLLTDFYELTMMQGYFKNQSANKTAVFDVYYRKNPFGNGYVVVAGLEQVIDYVLNIKFSKEDIDFLRDNFDFEDEFLEYLSSFKFTGDIYALKEGTVAFPNEPLLTVKAPIIQAQFLESAILNIINHQTLIATKAARIKQVTGDDGISEFGLRRAQGPDAAIFGTRASIIGGFDSTSNVLAAKKFNIPASGTHSHSWIMSFESEYKAFYEYARCFKNNIILLLDTYDVLKSGLPNAIRVFKNLIAENEKPKKFGVRIDSGDFAYLTKKIREELDRENLYEAQIIVSNDLDENLILYLKNQGAKINAWGIGTKLITGDGNPSLGGVYKMVAMENKTGKLKPKIKISENPEKISTPGFKQIFRIYNKASGKIKMDLLALHDENFLGSENICVVNENISWRKINLDFKNYFVKPMLEKIIENGKRVSEIFSVCDIKKYCNEQKETLWEEYKRIINPEVMFVCLSEKLFDLKQELLNKSY